MKIAIDGNEANVEEKVGVNQYAWQLLTHFYRMRERGQLKHDFTIYLSNKPNRTLPEQKSYWNYEVLPGEGLWILKKLTPALMKKSSSDVFFSPNHYLPPFSRIPMVCTIHDLGYLMFSAQFNRRDFWQLKYWSAISIFISKYIITVSDFTKKDIVRHYPFASKKIEVTHHGYDKTLFNNNISNTDVRRIKRKFKIEKNYILFLSTLKPSKNIEGLIDAFKILSNKYSNYQLVIAGKKGWLYKSIFEKVKKLDLGERIVFTDYVKEGDKPYLIKGAKVFVIPSFWEGFGMDSLNAMACGVALVVSNVASLPEVVGDAGVYVDPKSIVSIAKGIDKVLSMNKNEYNKLISKGFRRLKMFSWDKCAKDTIKILEKAT